MLRKIGLGFVFFLAAISGAALIEMGLREPDYELASRIFSVICGAILILPGVIIGIMELKLQIGTKQKSPSSEGSELVKGIKSEVSPHFFAVQNDSSQLEANLRRFRTDLSAFFQQPGTVQNPAVQSDVTQIFRQILSLQKSRLDRKQLRLVMESERMRYGSLAPVRSKPFFDGKYRVIDVTETIQAKRTFFRPDGKKLKTLVDLQTAFYRLLHAEKRDAGHLICPNCGGLTTRENLLDGCDYCGTKFTVEDLGTRVASFAFRPDYEVEYAKHQDIRDTYTTRVGLIVGIPVFLLSAVGMFTATSSLDTGYVMKFTAAILGVSLLTASAVFFGLLAFYFLIFPFLQARASLTYYSKRRLERMKASQQQDNEAQRELRMYDGLFSLSGFYLGVQNRLATIHFADTQRAACAFCEGISAETQVSSCLPNYRDVIDMDVSRLELENYQCQGPVQQAVVSADLALLEERGGRVRRRRESVTMLLIKDAACKTQSVCAPSFLRCPGCGASISLLEGCVCAYCGTRRRLSQLDWAIADYTVTKGNRI